MSAYVRNKISFFIIFFLLQVQSYAQFGFDKIDDDPLSLYNIVEWWSRPIYNRVEGVVPHLGFIFNPKPSWAFSVVSQVSYGTKSDNWRYKVGLEKRFFDTNRLIARMETFDETYSNDFWLIGKIENSIAGLLLREDFCDYYRRKGWRIFADQKFFRHHLIRLTFSQYRNLDMTTRSNFAGSLLGDGKKFRPNPPVIEGFENSINLSLYVDTRDNPFIPNAGVFLTVFLEKTFGDFNTQGIFVDGRLYMPTWGNQRLVCRQMIGVRRGDEIPQYSLHLGGIGSMRAYPDRCRAGRYFALFRTYYLCGGDFFKSLTGRYLSFMEATSLGFFFELGDAWTPERVSVFSNIELLADAGVSLLLLDGLFRIDLAWKIDKTDNGWRLTCRLFDHI